MRNVLRLNPPALARPAGQPPGYTHVVVATGGRTIYVSGQVALDVGGKLVGQGDFPAQAKQVFDNLASALAAANATFADVVKTNIYLTDAARLDEFRQVRSQYFVGDPPASTLVVVAGLYRPDLMVEVDAIAVTSG